MRTISANAVGGRSYEIFLHENLSYESFFTRKFPDLRYSVTTLCGLHVIGTGSLHVASYMQT